MRNQLTFFLAFLRKNLSAVFILAGALLLGYVCAQYYGMWHEQKSLAQKWQEQQQQSAEARLHPGAATFNPSDELTRLEIPRIALDAIVVDGTGHKQLKVGPGRIISSAQPGEPGNSVISGHRDTFFRHIYELVKGDEILVRRGGELYRYQVTGKKIVDPEDLSVIKQTTDPQLTLITCYPTYYIGPAPQRLVVFSKLKDSRQDTPITAETTSPDAASAH